jgi:serine/threonine protein kinase
MSTPDSADPRALVAPTPDAEETTGVTAPPVDFASMHGAKVGRFVVLGDLGAGGMGHVVRAFDPQLGREVALKRLHADGPEASARAIREAQAVASLSHPNVIAVYDFGEHDDAIFIALELVEGKTLREWMSDGPYPWAIVLDRLEAAGRGLAAAHRVGLVHRDFKPSNVLVGDDGRVRVTDFGLARFIAAPSDAMVGDASDSLSSGDVCLTRSGVVLGTPAYMAPEQHAGASDPSSDQYAFCVVLFEALYGERPFRGATQRELVDGQTPGRARAALRGAGGARAVAAYPL